MVSDKEGRAVTVRDHVTANTTGPWVNVQFTPTVAQTKKVDEFLQHMYSGATGESKPKAK